MTKKERGAYYTPYALADKMCEKIITNGTVRFLEPSFGDGVFISAIKLHCKKLGISMPHIKGVELDYETAKRYNINEVPVITDVEVRDFLSLEEDVKYDVVIGNPPYITTKTTTLTTQERAKRLSTIWNVSNSLNNSLWFSFILKSLMVLAINGTMSFILPTNILTTNYAKQIFPLLTSLFSSVTIDRIYGNVFDDAEVKVVILTCEGYDKGDTANYVNYNAYESLSDYLNHLTRTTSKIEVSTLSAKFIDNIPLSLSKTLSEKINRTGLTSVKELCVFKQGYIAGHSFFHPTKEEVGEWGIEKSLIPCISSGRSLNKVKELRVKEKEIEDRLYLPDELSSEDILYIQNGEAKEIHQKYKCSRRDPWYLVPNVTYPDIVIPFLCDTPRLLINDKQYAHSCSILGGNLSDDISPEMFVCIWYNSLTLYNVERTVKQLGGGCLNFTPKSINELLVVPEVTKEKVSEIYYQLNECYKTQDIASVYKLGDQLVLQNLYGFTTEEVCELQNAVAEMKRLRNFKE